VGSYGWGIAVYALLVTCLVALALVAHRPGSPVPTFGRVLSSARTSKTGRVFMVLGWWWVGWHVFVR
jgi:hypothetical protein